jgi:hypothetical protein
MAFPMAIYLEFGLGLRERTGGGLQLYNTILLNIIHQPYLRSNVYYTGFS